LAAVIHKERIDSFDARVMAFQPSLKMTDKVETLKKQAFRIGSHQILIPHLASDLLMFPYSSRLEVRLD
jgi:hypothetical protein